MSSVPEGLQKQLDAGMEFVGNWRPLARKTKCAVMVSNDPKVQKIDLGWKCGKEELPNVNQNTYLGVEFSKNCTWDAQKKKSTR